MADKEPKEKNNEYKVVGKTKTEKRPKKEEKIKGEVIIEEKAQKQIEKERLKEKEQKENENQLKREGSKGTKVAKKKKVNKVLLTILLILAIIVIIVGILYGGRIINKAKLDNEIEMLSSKSIENDDFSNIELQTSGDYAIVEKAIKEFYSEYSMLRKDFINQINDEKIQNMLTIENYKNDGPNFEESLNYIKTAQEEFNQTAENLENLLTEENIMARIENQNLSSYYINLYKNYFFEGDNLAVDLQKSYQDTVDAKELMNNLYNNETKILNFLVENNANWEIVNDKLTFDSAALSAEYNTLKTQLYAE